MELDTLHLSGFSDTHFWMNFLSLSLSLSLCVPQKGPVSLRPPLLSLSCSSLSLSFSASSHCEPFLHASVSVLPEGSSVKGSVVSIHTTLPNGLFLPYRMTSCFCELLKHTVPLPFRSILPPVNSVSHSSQQQRVFCPWPRGAPLNDSQCNHSEKLFHYRPAPQNSYRRPLSHTRVGRNMALCSSCLAGGGQGCGCESVCVCLCL